MAETNKRKKPGTPEMDTSSPFPAHPMFYLMKHQDPDKTLIQVSPFLIENALKQGVSTPLKYYKKLRSGSVIIESTTPEQSQQLTALSSLLGQVPVTVTPHDILNHPRGVIRSWDLIDASEDEITTALASQHVINTRKLSTQSSTTRPPAFALTFSCANIPEHVVLLSIRLPVTSYIKPPLRCTQCFKYGHGAPCRGSKVCGRCSKVYNKDEHNPDQCSEPIKCVACNSPDHDVKSNLCPAYIKEKQALKLSQQEQITIPEARKFVTSLPAGSNIYKSYAQATRPQPITAVHQNPPPLSQVDFPPTLTRPHTPSLLHQNSPTPSHSQPHEEIPTPHTSTTTQPISMTPSAATLTSIPHASHVSPNMGHTSTQPPLPPYPNPPSVLSCSKCELLEKQHEKLADQIRKCELLEKNQEKFADQIQTLTELVNTLTHGITSLLQHLPQLATLEPFTKILRSPQIRRVLPHSSKNQKSKLQKPSKQTPPLTTPMDINPPSTSIATFSPPNPPNDVQSSNDVTTLDDVISQLPSTTMDTNTII